MRNAVRKAGITSRRRR
ncbi:hypothetical protein U4Z50_20285 [Escherichia coli]|nr:hypothetical protein [Escherichia coli]MDZ7167585.1 hypothetical protein [Escherichia coli]